MVVALVEEEGRRAHQGLLALWEGGLEQMGLSYEHEPGGVRASQHHARATENVTLEDLSIPKKCEVS